MASLSAPRQGCQDRWAGQGGDHTDFSATVAPAVSRLASLVSAVTVAAPATMRGPAPLDPLALSERLDRGWLGRSSPPHPMPRRQLVPSCGMGGASGATHAIANGTRRPPGAAKWRCRRWRRWRDDVRA